MSTNRKYTDDFKKDAIQYYESHPELGLGKAAEHLSIPKETLYGWIKIHRRQTQGCEDASSSTPMTETEKELARLRRENRDLQDALAVLKKAISILND